MSTILKALKQAEKDCPDQENENSPSFNVRTVLSPRMQQKRSNFLSSGRVVIPLVVISVAIIFYIFFPINNNFNPQPAFTGKQSQVLDTQVVIGKGQEQIVTKSTPQSFDLPRTPNERVLTPEPVHQVPVRNVLSKKVKENPLAPLDTDFLKKMSKPFIKQKIKDPAPLTGEAPTSGQSKMKDSVKDEKELLKATSPNPIILPLENDSLKVQAISWDQRHANRIAVIDNHVLREGDFVQGYRLVSIEKDSVILHYSGNDYRLGFRYR